MTTGLSAAVGQRKSQDTTQTVNDFVIQVATANGTGSQSANHILTRSIFHMGVPVSAKNLFPSNIQGLPTWFSIRINRDGWTACHRKTDLMVCMNGESAADDMAGLEAGSCVIIREELMRHVQRDDLQILAVPFSKLASEACADAKLRRLMINIMYVGVLAHHLDLKMEEVHKAIDKQFGRKPATAEMNRDAVDLAYQWAKANLPSSDRFRIERMDGSRGKILIEGNTAAALGAIWGGVTVTSWYPITPSSSVAEALMSYLRRLRHDPQTGKATYAVIQAEDELAAIGMVVGAGWMGARAMTATSGPGLSLMAEMAGLAYFAEVPAVIFDVQRMGPSTGLPTRTSQGDIIKAYYLSHGDCRHPCLIPGNAKECFEFACESFNFAERFQTLVILLSDLDLGMNLWMSETFEPPSKPIDRGKVLTAGDLDRLGEFARYGDAMGDGIPHRTLPGTDHPKAAYFTRGTGHTEQATYSEKPEDWKRNIDRLERKFETIRKEMPEPLLEGVEGADCGVIAYGSSDPAVREAVHMLGAEHGLDVEYLRIRALPVHARVYEFIKKHERVYVVEQNRDAQMLSILRSERPELGERMRSLRHYDGTPLDAQTIIQQILESPNNITEGKA